jgi:hypothetical protein
VIGAVVTRFEHRGCCEQFAGRVVAIESPVDESGAYVPPRPFCAVLGAELWQVGVDPVEWRPPT